MNAHERFAGVWIHFCNLGKSKRLSSFGRILAHATRIQTGPMCMGSISCIHLEQILWNINFNNKYGNSTRQMKGGLLIKACIEDWIASDLYARLDYVQRWIQDWARNYSIPRRNHVRSKQLQSDRVTLILQNSNQHTPWICPMPNRRNKWLIKESCLLLLQNSQAKLLNPEKNRKSIPNEFRSSHVEF